MGLITKAINKVEKGEKPPVQQETPPQPKGKKKVSILLGAFLFIGIFLGLGYFLLLKPTPDAPPKVVRRSISAKRRAGKPKIVPSSQKKDAKETKTLAEGKGAEVVSEQKDKTPTTDTKSLAESQISPIIKENETQSLLGQKEKTPESETQLPIETSESQISKTEKEPETPESIIERPSESVPISEPIKEEEILIDAPPKLGEKEPSQDLSLDKTVSSGEGEMPAGEMGPSSYATDLEDWLVQKPLKVTQRSDVKAQRFYNKGVSYQKQGKFDQSIDLYSKALRFNPDHMQTRMNLATAYLQTGRFKEAEEQLNYLYFLKSNDSYVLFNLGLLLYQVGELASAEAKIKKLLILNPLHLEANLLISSIYEGMREFNKAVEFCMKAHYIDSADPRVLYRVGRAWDMAGDQLKAVKYYRLFLNTGWKEEHGLRSAVRDRLNYLITQKEGEK